MPEQPTIVHLSHAKPCHLIKKWFPYRRLETIGGLKKLEKTRSAKASLKASDDVITTLSFEQPTPPLFSRELNFICAKNRTICSVIRIITLRVIE
jgi:hypothetical protein